MELSSERYELHAIGHVMSSARESQHRTKEGWAVHESSIVIKSEFAEAAKGLCVFCSTAWIIYGIDRITDVRLEAHPRGDKTRQPRGCFSVSTPARPNHLGVTEVILLHQEALPDGRVRIDVKGLDALDGSPVFDIKGGNRTPYAENEVRQAHKKMTMKQDEQNPPPP